MHSIHLATLASDDIVPLVAVVGGLSIVVLSIIFRGIGRVLKTKAREETKREVAAYVAEGSISPEDAERILQSDIPSWVKDCRRKG